MVAVNLLIVLSLCSVVGAFTGLLLGGLVGDLYLAIIAGVLATAVAVAVRNIRIPQLVVVYSTLAIERPIPLRVIICSAIASLVGSAAAVQVATMTDFTSSVMIGALAGLFAGILMVMMVIIYDRTPRRSGRAGPS
jgi:hypothetical protein